MSVKIFDTNEHFYLMHFDDYSENLDEFRGVIIERNDEFTTDEEGSISVINGIDEFKDYIVCKSFPFTPEYDVSIAKDIFEEHNSGSKFYPSFEGTVLRLYNYKGEWFLSTHKKISAFHSRWGSSKSFGQMFLEQLNIQNIQDVDSMELNKNKIYTFLLRTSYENRIVCRYNDMSLFYIGSFDREHDFKYELDTFPNVNCIPEIPNINTFEDLESYIQRSDEFKEQGVVMVNNEGRSYKILNPRYTELFVLRKNETNIFKAYIMNMQDGTHREFCKLYPEFSEKLNHFDNAFNHIVGNIYKNYINRYIKNNVAIAPPEQYNIMKSIYEQYLKRNSDYVYITKALVTNHILEQDPNTIFNLYFLYSNRENLYGNGNKVEEHIKNRILI